ncbi:MAG: hypothetical protein HYR55_14795 [Acidobacteria bacterium]|nr:hypothetical protein [Acidobacteriota bacterium]MBI3657303.1 hypothetical protein [Acidobacteriota bacterium]
MTQSSFSYLIFKDGATINAQNGVNGTIDFTGADAATVIQSAIAALTQGGFIFIKEGTYLLNSTLLITKGSITLEGQGRERTILTLPSGSTPTVAISVDGTGTSGGIYNITLRNFSIDGPNQTGTQQGIKVNTVYRSTIEGMYVSNLGSHGIEWITGFYNRIVHCHVENLGASPTPAHGIYLHNTVNASEVLHTHVRACSGAALRIETATDGVAVIGGSYQSSQYGIQAGQMNNLHLTDIYFEGNTSYDLYVAPGGNNLMQFLTVKGCNFADAVKPGSVYLDHVISGVFLGGHAANPIQTTSTCDNVFFLDFIMPGSGNTLNGTNILLRNGLSLQYWNNNVLINEIAGGGLALQINGQQGDISVQTLTAPGPLQQLSERTRWTTGADTSKVQILNANLEVDNILQFTTTPAAGVNVAGANIRVGNIKLTTFGGIPSTFALPNGYAAFGRSDANLALFYNDNGAIKSVILN